MKLPRRTAMTSAKTSRTKAVKFVPLSPTEARENLRKQGITITGFAKAHKLQRDVVSDVLRGKLHGNYGKSHKAAVALGIKANPEIAAKSRTIKSKG